MKSKPEIKIGDIVSPKNALLAGWLEGEIIKPSVSAPLQWDDLFLIRIISSESRDGELIVLKNNLEKQFNRGVSNE